MGVAAAWYVLAGCAASFSGAAYAISGHPLVLLVAIDGFGYDYLDRGLTPTLRRLKDEGSSAPYMYNVFPTVTYPNFFAIATGLYPETNGVIGNRAFNERYQCLWRDEDQYELFHYLDNVTPLWTLNELSGKGRYSGTSKWPSSQFTYRNREITHNNLEDQNQTSKERVDQVIRWFLDDNKPANLAFLYFSQIDAQGHYYGPNSPELNDTLKEMNGLLDYLLQALTTHGLRDKMNLIILSDHGMLDLPPQNVVDVRPLVDNDTCTMCGESPVWQVKCKPGYEKDMHEKLSKMAQNAGSFDVYRRDEIPERLHVKHTKRQADLLLVAKPHYFFWDAAVYRGDHGYDPDVEMKVRPIFIANGPLFKSNQVIEPFPNVDIFPLVSAIMNLDPPPIATNGTIAFIKDILKNY